LRIGVVSDTHGQLRPELLPILAGVDRILHLGDVGNPAILDALRRIAPVTAIRGNIDTSGICAKLPATELVTLGGKDFYLLHDLNQLDMAPAAAKIDAVLYGHSHRPEINYVRGILYFNPGSCGPRRFQLPITCGLITIDDTGQLHPEIVELPSVAAIATLF
jgi:putative phosphoesterase